MSRFVSFHALIEAVTGAVDEAQSLVERSQIDVLKTYLDGDRPRTLELSLPSMRSDAAAGERDIYSVPLLALAPHNAVRIKTVEVQFDVELGELDPRPDEDSPADGSAGRPRSRLTVDPASANDPTRRATQAHVTLVVEGVERPEAISRLIDELMRTQGFAAPPPKGSGGETRPADPRPGPGPVTPPRTAVPRPLPEPAPTTPAPKRG